MDGELKWRLYGIQQILSKDLNLCRVSVKFISKSLSAEQKVCQEFLNRAEMTQILTVFQIENLDNGKQFDYKEIMEKILNTLRKKFFRNVLKNWNNVGVGVFNQKITTLKEIQYTI